MKAKNLPLILVLLTAAYLLTTNISKPFIGHHDWNGAFWGSITKRYLTFTPFDHLNQLTNIEPTAKSLYFYDYTPLLPILFTFSSILFGFSESSLRLTSVIFSLILIIFIYKIGEFLFNKSIGLLAAIFAAVTPMFLYFGKLPDHEPIVASLVTVAFYFFLRSSEKNKKSKMLFLFFLSLSLLESWPAFFIIPPIILFSIFYDKKRSIGKLLPIVVLPLIIIGIHLSAIFFLHGKNGLLIFFQQGLLRMNSGTELIGGFSNFGNFSFIKTEASYAVIQFTKILTVLSLIWVIMATFKIVKRKIPKADLSLLILLAYPLSFILVFRQLAFIHDYKLYHFLPFISLSSAIVSNNLISRIKITKFKLVQIFIYTLIVIFIYTERIDYLNTLQNTNFNLPGYELGILIKDKTTPEEITLVNSRQFKAFFEVFVDYYSGRPVSYEDITLNNYKNKLDDFNKYRFIVLIDDRDSDLEFSNYLETTYKSDKYGPYRFFDINKRLTNE